MSTNRPESCEICGKRAFGYNYDVVSCNACKMFFRRANAEKMAKKKCRLGGQCFDVDNLLEASPKCRPCRFVKCKKLGMKRNLDSEILIPTKPEFSEIAVVNTPIVTQSHIDSNTFQKIKYMNETRIKVYKMINVCEDPSFLELVLQDSNLAKYMKPHLINWETTERKLKPWGSLGVMVIAEVVKTMDFYKELLFSDKVLLLKNVAFKSHHLSIAFDSFIMKKGRVLTPTGDEMLPQEVMEIEKCNEVIDDLLTIPMQPLLKLEVTENEFLLLNMIMICNPGIPNLSQNGKDILYKHQCQYTRLLLQICLQTDPKTGPSRLLELLRIGSHLDKQAKITHRMLIMFRQLWNPRCYIPKVLKESCGLEYLV
ncbi:unnamed protein product [Caenorhabditis nigoni]